MKQTPLTYSRLMDLKISEYLLVINKVSILRACFLKRLRSSEVRVCRLEKQLVLRLAFVDKSHHDLRLYEFVQFCSAGTDTSKPLCKQLDGSLQGSVQQLIHFEVLAI